MFNIYLIIYAIISIAVIVGGTFKIYGMNESVGALVFCIGSSAIFLLFGLRWFGASNSIFSKTPVRWPPTINSCPDYLTLYKRKLGNGTVQDTCVDLVGVSRNGNLKLFPKEGDPPASDDYYFSLKTANSDAASRNSELCQRALSFGLTWEGITNGESCTFQQQQSADSSNSDGSSDGENCKA